MREEQPKMECIDLNFQMIITKYRWTAHKEKRQLLFGTQNNKAGEQNFNNKAVETQQENTSTGWGPFIWEK